MKPTTLAGLSAAALLVSPAIARGAGFQLGEESAAATAMAGAFTAKADDASAIYYNAAGIARQRGFNLYVGGMLIVEQPSASDPPTFTLPNGEVDGHTKVLFLPNFYGSYGTEHHVAIGLGVFTNYGLRAVWPADWQGRFLATYTDLETATINPTIAWSPVSWFSVGAGVDLTFSRAKLRRNEDLVASEAVLHFAGNDFAVGGNLGVLFQTPDHNRVPPLSFGVQWRSRYNISFEDGAIRLDAPPELSATLHDAKASATVKIPDLISAGVGVRPVEPLFLQVQFDWTNWARFNQLQLTAADAPQLNLTIPENWKNGYDLRFGGEYDFHVARARLGFGYDWSPVPAGTLSPQIPDSSRFLISGGALVQLPRNLNLETAVMGVILRSRQSELPEFPVKYSAWAVLVSVGLSYRSHAH